MIHLRPYQSTIVEQLRAQYAAGRKSPLVVLPTGGGKTAIFAHIAANAARKGTRSLLLCHRAELVDQISNALKAEDAPHGFCAAGYPARHREMLTVGSIQTVARRLDSITPPDFIIVDEAHHAISKSWMAVCQNWHSARLLGVTATPLRLSGEGLGHLFDHMILGPTTGELIEAGYLAPYDLFAPATVDTSRLHVRAGEFIQSEVAELVDKPTVVGSAIAQYKRHADGKRAAVFCYSVDHSRRMAQEFRDAGYSAYSIDGATGRDIRRAVVQDFRDGRLTILCSCDVLAEGFDAPGIEAGVFLRPTASKVLWIQQVGRCLRTAPGKDRAILLDHVGNSLRHGLPDDDQEWSLDGSERNKRGPRDVPPPVRVCPVCFSAGRPGPQKCRHCGHVFEVESREVEHVEGDLVAVKRAQRRQMGYELSQLTTLAEFQEYGRSKGYAPGWAFVRWKVRQRKG